MGLLIVIYIGVVVINVVFASLLNSIVKKHCQINSPTKRLAGVYWLGLMLIIGLTVIFALPLKWTGTGVL